MREALLNNWSNGGYADGFFTYDEYVFSSMGNSGKNCVALLQCSEMSAELHFRNLILGINCFVISTLNVAKWLALQILPQTIQEQQRKDQDLKKSFKIKFHEILSLRIISKIIANREKKKI